MRYDFHINPPVCYLFNSLLVDLRLRKGRSDLDFDLVLISLPNQQISDFVCVNMVVASPPTPPSTAPTSPRLVDSPCVIDILEDEKACYDEKRGHSDPNRPPVEKGPLLAN